MPRRTLKHVPTEGEAHPRTVYLTGEDEAYLAELSSRWGSSLSATLRAVLAQHRILSEPARGLPSYRRAVRMSGDRRRALIPFRDMEVVVGWPELVADAQRRRQYVIAGTLHARIPFGSESWLRTDDSVGPYCPDCVTELGEL